MNPLRSMHPIEEENACNSRIFIQTRTYVETLKGM